MQERHRESAERTRRLIERGPPDPAAFRAVLLGVPPDVRDAWVDVVLGLEEPPDDGPELPRGCVPYLPCPVDPLLRMLEQTSLTASDVFVDVGSGLGRAAALVHLLTGASAVGIEIQTALVLAARELVSRLFASRIASVQGDAAEVTGSVTIGSVFFFYCPFSGERLAQVLSDLESIARTRMIRVCCVDLPLPERAWLTALPQRSVDLTIYRSTLHHDAA